jgi:hypothetical protein
LATGWKDKLTDRLVRMQEKLRDRLANRMEDKLRDGFLKRIEDKFRDRLLKRMEDKLRDRLTRMKCGQIKRQAFVKEGKKNLAIFRFLSVSLHFAYFPFVFAVSLQCETSYHIHFFPFQAKRNFRFDIIFRFGTENDGAP